MNGNPSLENQANERGVSAGDLNGDGSIKPYGPPQNERFGNENASLNHPYTPQNASAIGRNPINPPPLQAQTSPPVESTAQPRGMMCDGYDSFYRYYAWMARNPGIPNRRIWEAILPGSHNAAFDKQAPFGGQHTICQDYSPLNQLTMGVRVLDLRVQFYFGYGIGDPRRFSIIHGVDLRSGRTVKEVLDMVNQFRIPVPRPYESLGQCSELFPFSCPLPPPHPGYPNHHFAYCNDPGDPRREIVIIDIHETHNFTVEAHIELANIIKNTLGSAIIDQNLSHLRIGEIWQQQPGKNTVVAYNYPYSDPSFWQKVDQKWHGNDTISTSDLKRWMDTINEQGSPSSRLVAVQCAKYNKVVYTPDDFKNDINYWFQSYNSGSYIQRFRIINTDWTTRSYIVGNCAHANTVFPGAQPVGILPPPLPGIEYPRG